MPNYDGAQLCSLDPNLAVGTQNKWPMLDVTWTIVGNLPTLTAEGYKSASELAWSYWMEVCGIRLHWVEQAARANILMGIQTGTPGGVLADSELPFPGISPQHQLRQRYDTAEDYVVSENPPNNKVDVVRIIAHEGGHALGSGHISMGNLLAPTYSSQIRKPRAGDIAEMVARYGLPGPVTPPPPPPSGALDDLAAWLTKGGQVWVRTNGVPRQL